MRVSTLLRVALALQGLQYCFCWGFEAEGPPLLSPHLTAGGNGSAQKGAPARPTKQEKVETEAVESSREVLETQHATCQVTTEELVATAEATVTRVLKGLCNAKEMDDRFHNLETQLADQLNVIKTMILNMEDKLVEQDLTMRKMHKRLLGTLLRSCSSLGVATKGFQESRYPEDVTEADEETVSPRADEIARYNSSILSEVSASRRVFTLYWRIPGIDYKLRFWNEHRHARSPNFYVSPGGYRMYLKFFPRRDGGHNVSIQAGLTGGNFDGELPWPFALKLRVGVLDQVADRERQEDISSRLWDPTQLCSGYNWKRPGSEDNHECVGLGLPQDTIRSRHYVFNDSIVIKFSVYLQ